MDILQLVNEASGFNLLPWQLAAVVFAALCIGMSKTGLSGITTVIIPVLALIFGAKESTGVILPMLCFADILAVIWYRRSAAWKYLAALLPWALAGFAAALLVDRFVPARAFKMLIGVSILFGLAVMFWGDFVKLCHSRTRSGNLNQDNASAEKVPEKVPGTFVSAAWGIAGGFTTMIGNAAGPIMSVFLLSKRLPKEVFVGTAAWFFMIVNYLKIPVQHFAWHNIRRGGLVLDAMMIPFIVAGAVLGVVLVKKVSERVFRVLVYVLTIVSSILLFV